MIKDSSADNKMLTINLSPDRLNLQSIAPLSLNMFLKESIPFWLDGDITTL